jgi:shikimate dehydrogenase
VIEIRGTTTLVGLLGWPTSHSLSPPMQNAGFAVLGLDWAYVPLPTPPERLGEAVRGLVAVGFAGANVTIPHKEAVIALCDDVDDVAARAGSVNTLVIRDDRVLGSSTDGLAVTSQIETEGRRALVLGTGGAAKAVASALEEAHAEVVVRGRRDPGWPPSADGFDVLVNATPLKEEVVVAPHPGTQVVDLAYHPDGSETALIATARAIDGPCDDGLDDLLAQGAASFERWTGAAAPLLVMRTALRGGRDCAAPSTSGLRQRFEERQDDRVEGLGPFQAREVPGAGDRRPRQASKSRRQPVRDRVEVAVVVLADEDERRDVDLVESRTELVGEEHLLAVASDLEREGVPLLLADRSTHTVGRVREPEVDVDLRRRIEVTGLERLVLRGAEGPNLRRPVVIREPRSGQHEPGDSPRT